MYLQIYLECLLEEHHNEELADIKQLLMSYLTCRYKFTNN